jgi:integrating conjugative element relaxase (TIGR03760 family)
MRNLLGFRNDLSQGDVAVKDALAVGDPAALLGDHLKIIDSIRKLVGVPQAHWEALYATAFDDFATFVQRLPASESHHHARPGGLLIHGLEVVRESLKLRRGRLIPSGASAEKLMDCQDLWTYATAMAALLHDLGKPVTDQRISLYDTQGRELGRWNPITGPFPKEAAWYKVEFVRDRSYPFHERIPPLLAHFILPPQGLQWIASDPEVFQAWLATISGDDDHAGVLGELVHHADGLSVAGNLTDSQPVMPSARRIPLSTRLLTGLRYLLDQGTLPLNRPGAAGWYRDDDVWLVSKRVLDTLRDHLTQDGQEGIPSRNDRLMDELQQHGLLIPHGDRAIWTVKITDGNWSQQLTVLRFAAPTLWPDPEGRPTAFSGTITPVNPLQDTSPTTRRDHAGPPKGKSANAYEEASDTANGNRETLPPHPASSDDEPSSVHSSTMPKHIFSLTPDAEEITDLGQYFLQWLKGGLSSGRLPSNAINARVHTLPQGLFLVSPGIFKDFDRLQWAKAQTRFLKLKLHQRTPAGLNIWTCQVKGKHKQSRLRGLLLPSPEQALGLQLPPPNPYLTLQE